MISTGPLDLNSQPDWSAPLAWTDSSESGSIAVEETNDYRADIEKLDVFVAVLLSEQVGPLTLLQRDVLETIQNAVGRLADPTDGKIRIGPAGTGFSRCA